MRVKFYALAISLCCTLPFIALGADLDPDEPQPPPRSMSIPISPVIVDADFSMLSLNFTKDLGEVYIALQPIAGKRDYSQAVNTSIQNQVIFTVPSGTYILTIADIDGNIIQQESVVIP